MSTSVFAVNNRSEEFRRVDYLLKLSLRTPDIHDVSVWHFSNAHQASRFEQRTQDMEVLHAWVDVNDVDTNLDVLASRGFAFGPQGQRFVTGTLAYDATQASSSGAGGSGSGLVYRHEYVLLDPTQALPMYLVQFFPGTAPQKKLTDRTTSTSSSVVGGGGAGPQTVETLYDRYDFFDPVYYVPVSVRDKMVGSHSSGEAAQHKLISIADAYDAALAESLKPDPLLAQRQAEIKSQLRAVDAKLRDVNRNSAEVEERIYKALQDALFQLQDATQHKLNALLSEEVELRRQLQHVDWIETFLDRQRDEAEQVDFLNAWKCHVQLRGDMCRNPLRTSAVLASVQADLEFEGSVRVVSRTSLMQEKMLQGGGGRKRGQTGSLSEGTATRQGSGSMTMTNNNSTPSPIQQARTLGPSSQQQPQPPAQPVLREEDAASGNAGGGPVDVERAFAEQLRIETENMIRGTKQAQQQRQEHMQRQFSQYGQYGSGSNLLNMSRISGDFEVPPTPPAKPRGTKGRPAGLSERTPEHLIQFSLSAEALRRSKALKFVPPPEICFPMSQIISGEMPAPLPAEEKAGETTLLGNGMSDAQNLFLMIPFPSASVRLRLLYASYQDEVPSIRSLVGAMPKQEVEVDDGEGGVRTIVVPQHCPTVLLVRANGRTFGGYADSSWRSDRQSCGTAKAFLFSLTSDTKVPYSGRDPLPPSEGWKQMYIKRNMPPPKFASIMSDESSMQFGNGDLVLSNNFRECSSSLEHSFGFGLDPEDPQSELFLAGAPRFVCDKVELWEVSLQ